MPGLSRSRTTPPRPRAKPTFATVQVVTAPDSPAPVTQLRDDLAGGEVLSRLYAEQLARTPDDAYLHEHARPHLIAGQVAAFRWYRQFLPAAGTILDWGCNHAPDSCLLRAWAGDRYELHACDVGEPGRFPAFHKFARLAYSRLTHLYQIPYGDAQYDAVIASGVLEHTAMDYESLKELHRVLKPGGVLIVTYLPNRWSFEEWYRRNVKGRDFHRRLYGRVETRRLLRHYGFDVLADGYQVKLRSDWQGMTARVLPPVAAISSVLCFAARKVTGM